MRIGIVGAEAAKFTALGQERAKRAIRQILVIKGATEVISGGCHLGGIDIWAEEIGHELRLKVTVFKPKTLAWDNGYKERNLIIAGNSDELHNFTVKTYPITFGRMRFAQCYHCKVDGHVKSGGCWTMKKAKVGVLHIIENE
jgi:hypothetical protein